MLDKSVVVAFSLCGLALHAIAGEPLQFPRLVIKDDNGTVLDGAQGTARKEGAIRFFQSPWKTTGADGVLPLDLGEAKGDWSTAVPDGRYTVFLRAQGKAPATVLLDVPSSVPQVEARLTPGREVELKLAPEGGMKVPTDLLPLVVEAPLLGMTWASLQPSNLQNQTSAPLRLHEVARTGDGIYKVRVTGSTYNGSDGPGRTSRFPACIHQPAHHRVRPRRWPGGGEAASARRDKYRRNTRNND